VRPPTSRRIIISPSSTRRRDNRVGTLLSVAWGALLARVGSSADVFLPLTTTDSKSSEACSSLGCSPAPAPIMRARRRDGARAAYRLLKLDCPGFLRHHGPPPCASCPPLPLPRAQFLCRDYYTVSYADTCEFLDALLQFLRVPSLLRIDETNTVTGKVAGRKEKQGSG